LKTIFEPAKPYFKLLGNQKAQTEANYRLMHFVVQAEVIMVSNLAAETTNNK
jgi:hypothetical protein